MRLIDADALIKALEVIQYNDIDDLSRTEDLIDNAETVEEKSYAMGYQDGLEDGLQDMRPQGEWLESDVPESTLAKCSICGFDCGAKTHNFCPNCGAGMWKGGAE